MKRILVFTSVFFVSNAAAHGGIDGAGFFFLLWIYVAYPCMILYSALVPLKFKEEKGGFEQAFVAYFPCFLVGGLLMIWIMAFLEKKGFDLLLFVFGLGFPFILRYLSRLIHSKNIKY